MEKRKKDQGKFCVEMSANEDTGTVIFMNINGSALFPSPLPLPPEPFLVRLPTDYSILLHHSTLGLISLIVDTAVAPIERVHLLMQNQNEMIKSGSLSTPYKGMRDCFLRTIKQDGIISLWRGNCVNFSKALTSQALAFSMCKNSWHNLGPLGDGRNDEFGKFEAAAFSATLFQYPLDYARTRLATDVEVSRRVNQFSLDSAWKNNHKFVRTREFSGMFDVYRHTLLMNGVTGLYKGYFPSFLGILLWDFSKMKLEDRFRGQKMENKGKVARNLPTIMFYSLPVVFYPLTTVSRRMMMSSGKATTPYRKTMHAFREIVKNEGFSSLYKGVTAGVTLCLARLCAYKSLSETTRNLIDA